MSDRNRRPKRRKISLTKIIIASLLTVMALAVFPVVKHYLTYDMSWYGGLTRLINYMAAGVYFGVFPAIAGIVTVIDRYRQHKTVILPAVLATSVTWFAQYVIVLVTAHVGPSLSDATYWLLSAFCTAALALLVGGSNRHSTASL